MPPRKHKRVKKHQPKGGNIFTAMKLAPTLVKALLKKFAIKAAKKSALPVAIGTVAGTTGYIKGLKARRKISLKY